MATTSSWKARVEKGVSTGNYNDYEHSEEVDLGIKACGNGKRTAGRRPGMTDDDDATNDEDDDEDDN